MAIEGTLEVGAPPLPDRKGKKECLGHLVGTVTLSEGRENEKG